MPKNNGNGNNDDDEPPVDQYEGMSDNDRAYMEAMAEKQQSEQDTLDKANRDAETAREWSRDEDDKRDNDD